MYWRRSKRDWETLRGEPNREAFRDLVMRGEAHGLLAFAGDEPVGWVSLERRTDLPKLNAAPSLRCDDAEQVWAIACFYIKTGWRKRGVASALLRDAKTWLAGQGARIVEGYPSRVSPDKPLGNAFAWTGVLPMFESAGFEVAGPVKTGKQRVRWYPSVEAPQPGDAR